MDSDQPYRPPRADVSGPPAAHATPGGGEISRGIVETLAKTRPWVTFMGVMTMIGCGLMVLAGIGMTVFGALLGSGNEFGPFGGLAVGVLYVLLALVYFFPGLYLLQFGGALRRAGGQPKAAEIEFALGRQLRFWRFVGIFTIVVIVFYVLAMVIAIVAAVFVAAN